MPEEPNNSEFNLETARITLAHRWYLASHLEFETGIPRTEWIKQAIEECEKWPSEGQYPEPNSTPSSPS